MKKNVLFYVFYALLGCLALLNCSPKDVASVTPFTYTFKGISEIKMPEIVLEKPAEVVTTTGTVEVSAQAKAAMAELTSGKLSEPTQKFAEALTAAIPAAVFTAALGDIKSSNLRAVVSAGKLTDAQRELVASLKTLPAEFKIFFSKITLPTVNGKAVAGRRGVPEAPGITAPEELQTGRFDEFMAETDACRLAAQEAATLAIAGIDQQKTQQLARVEADYQVQLTAIGSTTTSCTSAADASKDIAINALVAAFEPVYASIESQKEALGSNYDLFTLLVGALLLEQTDAINTIYSANVNACKVASSERQTALDTAKSANITTVNASYTTARNKIQTETNAAVGSCHNQGGGK
jgi:hypothetical protein